MTEAVVDDYMRYRGETTALAVDTKARRAIARAWNASRKLPRMAAADADGAPAQDKYRVAAMAGFSGFSAGGNRKLISHP